MVVKKDPFEVVILQDSFSRHTQKKINEIFFKAVAELGQIQQAIHIFTKLIILGTILAHTFLMSKSCVKIWWTVNRFKFNSLLNFNRWSDLTRDLTFSTLSSVIEVESLPARGSSSTSTFLVLRFDTRTTDDRQSPENCACRARGGKTREIPRKFLRQLR